MRKHFAGLFYKPYVEIIVLTAKHVGEENGATSQLLLRFKDGIFMDIGKEFSFTAKNVGKYVSKRLEIIL